MLRCSCGLRAGLPTAPIAAVKPAVFDVACGRDLSSTDPLFKVPTQVTLSQIDQTLRFSILPQELLKPVLMTLRPVSLVHSLKAAPRSHDSRLVFENIDSEYALAHMSDLARLFLDLILRRIGSIPLGTSSIERQSYRLRDTLTQVTPNFNRSRERVS